MEPKNKDKKEYKAPQIVFESDLEVKAGSPCGSGTVDPIDLFPSTDNGCE